MRGISDVGIILWGSAYIICSIIRPDIFGCFSSTVGGILMMVFGSSMIIGLLLFDTTIGKVILLTTGILEVLAGVASWSGLITWNVPFQEKALFNISMTLLDFLGASVLIAKALNAKILSFTK